MNTLFKHLFSLLLLLCTQVLYAQKKVNLEVGKTIRIATCKNKSSFKGIDVYARTSPYNKQGIDPKTGDGLVAAFFSKNASIDAKRLPCSMGGKHYKIAALQEYETDAGIKKIVICYTNYDLTLIWIDLDEAMKANEITWH